MHLLMFWILFENVMALHRTKATLIGLLDSGRANEWVVTEKLGDANKAKATNSRAAPRRSRFKFVERYEKSYKNVVLMNLKHAVLVVLT